MRAVIRDAVLSALMTMLAAAGTAAGQDVSSPETILDEAQATLVADAGKGLALAREAETLERIEAEPENAVLLRAAWLEAEALFRLRRFDEAAEALSEALSTFSPDGSAIYGKLLITSGRVARARGENGLALQSFQEAFTLFSGNGNRRYQAIALQSIGTLYTNAKQWERAVEYDRRAVAIYPDDPLIQVVSLNNQANALRRMSRYDEARERFTEALETELVGTAPAIALRILSNLAAMEMVAGNIPGAREAIARVHELEGEVPDNQVPRLPYAVEAKLKLMDGQPDAAVAILDSAFADVDFSQTPEDEKEAHALAYEVYADQGLAAQALAHLEAFKRLDDAERNVAASANLAILNAEFELSNKELEIATLRSERLEADVALIRAKRQQERLLSAAGVLLAIAVIAFLAWQMVQSSRMRRITERLNQKLESVNQKLRRSNADLEKANSAKTEFLATTSHEIRTPLNAVINLTAAVMDDLPKGGDAHEKLATALSSAEHLHDIVSDVLDVARFEGNRVRAHTTDLELGETIGDVVNLWRPKAAQKGLRLDVECHFEADTFCTDEKLLRQLLSNLLSNAIKFTAEGHIELSAERGGEADPLVLRISDTGIGIADEDRDIIFESFKQVETGGTRSFGGTGLGLAICRQITELLGGQISVDSAPGQGSTFIVTLPSSPAPAPEARTLPAAEIKPAEIDTTLQGLRVLAAEDNAVNAMVIQAILKGKVLALTIVENGVEAVEAVRGGDFDVVLMDKQMPVMDGVEATRRIRALPGKAGQIPIVAVTADAFAAARDELYGAGADGYLSKPIKPDDLKRAIVSNCIDRGTSQATTGHDVV